MRKRILVLGLTKSGKITAATQLLRKAKDVEQLQFDEASDVFKSSSTVDSCTREIEEKHTNQISIVDFPGWNDTSGNSKSKANKQKFNEYVCRNTFHAILFVLKLDNKTNTAIVNKLDYIFALFENDEDREKMLKQMIILVTHCPKGMNADEQKIRVNDYFKKLYITSADILKRIRLIDFFPEKTVKDVSATVTPEDMKERCDKVERVCHGILCSVKYFDQLSITPTKPCIMKRKEQDCNSKDFIRSDQDDIKCEKLTAKRTCLDSNKVNRAVFINLQKWIYCCTSFRKCTEVTAAWKEFGKSQKTKVGAKDISEDVLKKAIDENIYRQASVRMCMKHNLPHRNYQTQNGVDARLKALRHCDCITDSAKNNVYICDIWVGLDSNMK